MPNIALLNNIEHKDLRIVAGHRPGLGSEVAWVPTFADEFRSLQGIYPIIFRQLEDGANFEAIALLALPKTKTCSCRTAAGMRRSCRGCTSASRSTSAAMATS